jgi:hypothetical protein
LIEATVTTVRLECAKSIDERFSRVRAKFAKLYATKGLIAQAMADMLPRTMSGS